MGNSRINESTPIEQSMQCDARTGICKPTRFQAEVYTDKVADRASQGQQMVSRELDGVLSRLQNAQEAFAQSGMRGAISEYSAAIRAADGIDQKAVTKERETIKELLKNTNLDSKTRRLLLQEDADLHTLQRAPGFARANFALLLIRNGDQFNGTQLLLEAQKKDYEMSRDPNFQRHLKYAIEHKTGAAPREEFVQYQAPRSTAQQRLAADLPQQAPPQGDPRLHPPTSQPPSYQPAYDVLPQLPQRYQQQPFRPSPQLVPGDPRLQPPPVPQQVADPRFRTQLAPQPFVPGDPKLQPPPVQQQQLPSDVYPLKRQYQQPDVTPLSFPVGRFAPLDSQGRSPVEAAQSLLASVTGPKTMTPEVRQQFESSIKNAMTGVSPKLAILQQQETLAANALKPLMAPDIAKVMVGFDRAVSNASQQMAPDKRQAAVQLYSTLDKTPNLAERQEVQKQLIQLNPALKDVLDKREQYLGPANVQLLLNYSAFKNAVATEKNQVAITQFMYGLALSKNGDGNEAKLHIAQALKLNRDPELTVFWKGVAAQLGVPTDKTQQPVAGGMKPPFQPGVVPPFQPGVKQPPFQPGAIQPPIQPGADRGKQTAPTDVRGLPPEAANPVIAGVSPENQGLRPDQILSKARLSLQQNGMTDATKKQFEDSIKTADSLFTPAKKEVADKLVHALQTGKKYDGSVLLPQERMYAHQVINNELQNSVSGIAMRMAYAELLSHNKQYATAGKVLQETAAAADRLPFGIFSAELDQLGHDLKNPQFNRASNADLLKMAQTLRGNGDSKEEGLIYLPLIVRKQAVEFYLSGRDGKPGVLQPKQAVALIDEAKNLAKQLYKTDLDTNQNWDPRLVTLAKESSKYLPENLKNEKAKADTFWSNALIDGGTAAAVFVAAGFAASAITRNPAFARMGLSTGEGALTLGGKATLVSGALLSATAGRHYTHALVTGDNESWSKSAIHGTAGLAGVAAIIGTRGQLNQVLFKGATEDAMWLRAAEARGTTIAPAVEGASSTKILTAGDAAAICAEQRIALSKTAMDFLAVPGNSAKILVQDGAIADTVAYEAMKLGLNPAQATSMARSFVSVTASGDKMSFLSKLNPLVPLDLATATSAQLSARSFYSGYTSAFAGLGTYNSVAAMDRSINPTTGKPFTYREQFMENNFRSKFDNTPVNALLIGLTPLLRDGAIARNMVVADASAVKRGMGYAKTPFVPSGMGAIGESATYVDRGRQAAYLGIASTVYDPSKIRKFFDGRDKAWGIGRNLDATQMPIQDFSAPIPQR